jgi:hypothetical protein
MNRAKTQLLPYLLVVSIIITACLFAGGTAFADPPGRKHVIQRHETQRSRVVANRHGDHRRPYARSSRHHQRRSPVYRKRPHFSLFVGAPIGTFITTPPVGYTRVVMRGASYSVAGGVYYQHVLGGYRVVEVPREVVIVDSPRQQTIPVAILPEQVKVSAAALNVRTGPGLHYSVVDQVQRGDTLQVISSAPGWLCVQIGSGQSGWVMDSFTVPVTGIANG